MHDHSCDKRIQQSMAISVAKSHLHSLLLASTIAGSQEAMREADSHVGT